MCYEARLRPELLRSADWTEAQWTKVARALDAIEARWMAHLAAPLDAAQIARRLFARLSRLPPRRARMARRAPVACRLGGPLRGAPLDAGDPAGVVRRSHSGTRTAASGFIG